MLELQQSRKYQRVDAKEYCSNIENFCIAKIHNLEKHMYVYVTIANRQNYYIKDYRNESFNIFV